MNKPCLFIIVVREHRSTIYVDVAYCCRPSSMVCLSVTVVNPAEMAESIEVSFGLWARMCQRNHILDGSQDPPWEGAIFYCMHATVDGS